MRNERDAGIISGRVLINLGFSPESDGVLLKGFKPGSGMILSAFRKTVSGHKGQGGLLLN